MHDERFAEGKEFSWQTACKRLCVSLPCTCVFTFERVWAQEPCPALLLSSVQPVAKTRSAAGFWLLALDRFFQSLAIWVEEDHVGKSRGLWKVKQTPHVNREKAEPAPSIWFNWLPWTSDPTSGKSKQTTGLLLSLHSKYRTTWEIQKYPCPLLTMPNLGETIPGGYDKTTSCATRGPQLLVTPEKDENLRQPGRPEPW